MAYFWMIVAVIVCTIQSPFKKMYQDKTDKGEYLFVSVIQLSAGCFFAGACLFGGKFDYGWDVLPYSMAFAVCATLCGVTSVTSLRYGSLALTALISSYSLMLPTIYGFVRFKNPIYVTQLVGILLLLVSLYLTNMGGEAADGEVQKQKGNFKKWLPLVLVMGLTNGLCAIVQTEQQYKFQGAHKNEFMMVAMLSSFLLIFLVGMLTQRRDIKAVLKHGTVPAVLCGACNGAGNLLLMVVTATIAASIYFPVLSAGSMVLAYVISVTLFKEKFTAKQKLGIALGVASLVFLNLSFGELGSL